MSKDESFEKVIYRHLGWAMTGSTLAVISTVLSIFGVQIPAWAAWVFLISGIIMAIYFAGRDTHGERRKLAEKLKPKLRIAGIGPPSHDHRRIIVHNLAGKTIRFKVRLLEIKPKIDYALPVGLQPTHSQLLDEAEIEAGGKQPVDVFVDSDVGNEIGLKLMGNPPCLFKIARDQRHELLICVYPVSEWLFGKIFRKTEG